MNLSCTYCIYLKQEHKIRCLVTIINHHYPEHGPEDDGVGGVLEPPGPGRHPEVQEAEAGDHPVTGEILKVQQMPLRVVQGDPVN